MKGDRHVGGARQVRGARNVRGTRDVRVARETSAAVERPPHYDRVRALLGSLDAPVVELWGWAGTGKRAILGALLEDEPETRLLPAAWLSAPERLEDRLARAVGRHSALLVCGETDDAAAIERVAAWLRPGQRMLVAVERRLGLGRLALATPVDAMLLRPEEIGALWSATAQRTLTAGERDRLAQWSDGWYLPLATWARDPATAHGAIDAEGSFGFAGLADFLRERVVAALDDDERDAVGELGRRGPMSWRAFVEGNEPSDEGRAAGGSDRRERALRSLVERVGLVRVREERLHLPRVLAEHLTAEALSRGGPRQSERRDGTTDAVASSRKMETPVAVEATTLPATASVIPIHRNWRDEREAVAADVRIGLLGLPRVEHRDASGALVPVAWSFKRPLRILAYLASAPDLQASREEIVSILWPESSEDTIRRNLHPAVSWLRRSVWPGGGAGGVVLLRDGVYSLDPTLQWEVDVRLFLERIEDGARHLARGRTEQAEASWEAAWRLYQGAFLQGWSDRWVLAQRDELQLRFTDLLRRLGDLKAQHGRLAEAEDAYRTLLLEDPLEEGVHVAIMRIYAARGRRDLVNRQYERLRQVLRQELGVDPSPPTLEVFNELMLAPDPRAYR